MKERLVDWGKSTETLWATNSLKGELLFIFTYLFVFILSHQQLTDSRVGRERGDDVQ